MQERERLTQAYRPSKVSEKVTTVLRKGCDLANIATSIATYTKHVRTITSLTIAVVSTGDRYVVEQYSLDLMILLSICLSIYLQAHIFIYYFYNPLAMRLYPSTHTTISIRIYVLFSFSGDEVKEQHIYVSSAAAERRQVCWKTYKEYYGKLTKHCQLRPSRLAGKQLFTTL